MIISALVLCVLIAVPVHPQPITPAQVELDGTASYLAFPDGHAAAGPALRHELGHDWLGTEVLVCRATATTEACVRERLVTSCQCYGTRLIDLPVGDFATLAPLGRGLTKVRITRSPA